MGEPCVLRNICHITNWAGYSFLVHFFVCSEAEKNARDEQAQLKDAIEAEKVRTEEDTTTASMEIARLKDDLLESR